MEIPTDFMDCFVAVCQENTEQSKETMALLCGEKVSTIQGHSINSIVVIIDLKTDTRLERY